MDEHLKVQGLVWWIERWRRSRAYADLSLAQQGAYRNLLDECALRGGPIPDDPRILARACGKAKAWPRVHSAVLDKFRLTADGWRNDTLDQVIKRSARWARYRARQ